MRRFATLLTLSVAATSVALVPACKNTLEPDAPTTWPALLSNASELDDQGPVSRDLVLRGILELGMRDRDGLEQAVLALYTQGSASFRQYLTTDQFDQTYGPLKTDLDTTTAWLNTNNLSVENVSSRALLLEFSGSVDSINTAFGFILHDFHPKSALPSDASGDIYAPDAAPSVPAALPSTLVGLLGFAPQFPEGGSETVPTLQTAEPAMVSMGLTPAQLAAYYGFTAQQAMGNTGAGSSIGIVAGFAYHDADVEGFWDGFRIGRDAPTEEPATSQGVSTYGSTTTQAVQWSGALAPDAALTTYEIPDASLLSTVYALHEAVGRNEVDVVADAFSHREDLLSPAISRAVDDAGLLGAALGITVLAGSGNSSGVDVPGSSSWITAVGGTTLTLDGSGNITGEHGWASSGCGSSAQIARPAWQPNELGADGFSGTGRDVCDVSMNAGAPVWSVNEGAWTPVTGTAISVSLFAAGIAVADQVRKAGGQPRLGWLNKRLYESTPLQMTFRDQTATDATNAPAGPGWDCSTGWGSLDLTQIATGDW